MRTLPKIQSWEVKLGQSPQMGRNIVGAMVYGFEKDEPRHSAPFQVQFAATNYADLLRNIASVITEITEEQDERPAPLSVQSVKPSDWMNTDGDVKADKLTGGGQ